METTYKRPTHRTPASFASATAAYDTKIKAMSDNVLTREAESTIWLSAFAANNPRSDYHWQVDAVYDECKRRGKPEIYNEAYKKASRS